MNKYLRRTEFSVNDTVIFAQSEQMKSYFIGFVILTTALNTCGPTDKSTSKTETMSDHSYTNSLIEETSPYLLQHAHNPVNWYAWNDESLKKAKDENKLMLISIGYAACHWCHVMEHESFEDSTVAKLMNDHFVCIKIDREERPDIDQIYMSAVQLMNQRGGWPLNCFATPDGKPFYGGTYFPKDSWMQILTKVDEEWKNSPDKIIEYANRLTTGIQQSELISINNEPALFTSDTLKKMVAKWSSSFDAKEGGPNRAPKFPIPNNYQFLLRYSHLLGDKEIQNHVLLTLDKMAMGGINDQIGGGFARYSTDALWKIPHFEKMLYDNGQLVSLYAEAYQATKNELYKEVVYETVEFIERELTSPEFAFYSSLDADSEGEEGKFYVWTKSEIETIIGADYNLFSQYYNINSKGLWEHGNYILLRTENDEEFAQKHNIEVAGLKNKVNNWKKQLLEVRATRIRPGLDDKSLTSWNALMLNGLIDAYHVFQDDKFLDLALKNATFIKQKQLRSDGGLNHNYKLNRSTINGYLEDYSFTIEAFINLYTATQDEAWLYLADKLTQYTILHFYDSDSGMFFFTSDTDAALIARKTEISDNVIPASNSSIAKGLFLLGQYFDNPDYTTKAEVMLNNMQPHITNYGPGYSNWGNLLFMYTEPFFEIAITGDKISEKLTELNQHYIPNKMILAAKTNSQLPLLEGKFIDGETTIFVCQNKSCKLPTASVTKALELLK